MAYEPFIDDPEHIRAVDRERFVVLRPSALLGEVHKQLQLVFANNSLSNLSLTLLKLT
jgi:hypothetical protein